MRPQEGRMIAGVCAGLAKYFGIPATVVRIAFLLTLLPGGVPGLLLYVLLWIVMPSEEVTTAMPKRNALAFQLAVGRKGGRTRLKTTKKKTHKSTSPKRRK